MKEIVVSDQEYNDFCIYLEGATGIVLGLNKHYLLSSRLNRMMGERDFNNYGELLKQIQKSENVKLREQVIDAMTTNETMWFRDNYPYAVLNDTLLPKFAEIKDRPLKIWSAACSSGQEPYSISMVVQEYIDKNVNAFPRGVQIVATDISISMLNYCKRAKYDESAMKRGVSEERRKHFFTESEKFWEISPEIKSRVTFKQLNLTSNYSALGKFDLIFCRNVLIYFSSELKTEILNKMSEVTSPHGYLYLGSSESPTRYTQKYQMHKTPSGVIYKLQG